MRNLNKKHSNSKTNLNLINGFYIKSLFSLIFFLFLIINIQTTSADVVSLNSGGSTNLSVSIDKYIEGFFFATGEAVGAVCGNGIIESGEQCDDGNTVSGDGCSATCQTEVVTPPGGGGGGAVTPPVNISVSPVEFNINLAVNTTTQRTISVTNLGTSQVIVGVAQVGLINHIILGNTTLTIPSGQTVQLGVVFVALDEPGIFTGTINIGNQQVLVSLNVKTKILLFDSNIVVLNKDFRVHQGQELQTLVTLIPLGDPERLDLTLNFLIKDYQNKVFLTKSETLLVDRLTELNRNFDTGILPIGDYIVGLELVYPNGVAPSSAHFQVTPPISFLGRLVLFLILMIIIVLILIIVILIWKRRKKKRDISE